MYQKDNNNLIWSLILNFMVLVIITVGSIKTKE